MPRQKSAASSSCSAGSSSVVDTVTFSTPITNPVMAIWSLGQNGDSTSFVFDQPFTIVAGGPSTEYNGQTITNDGNTVYGVEGNGTIQFSGTFSSISWTTPDFENWYGFSVGATEISAQTTSTVPLPSSFSASAVLLLGVLAARAAAAAKQLPGHDVSLKIFQRIDRKNRSGRESFKMTPVPLLCPSLCYVHNVVCRLSSHVIPSFILLPSVLIYIRKRECGESSPTPTPESASLASPASQRGETCVS